MNTRELSRRDFHQLAASAVGGVLAGTMLGCEPPSNKSTAPATSGKAAPEQPKAVAPAAADASATEGQVSLLMQERHVCRGLNMCKGQGAGKDNACAGQGKCASIAQHDCSGQNECKGQGGCGESPGENACKAKGGCSVPLKDHAWDTARKNFEAAMQKASKQVGAAPAKS